MILLIPRVRWKWSLLSSFGTANNDWCWRYAISFRRRRDACVQKFFQTEVVFVSELK